MVPTSTPTKQGTPYLSTQNEAQKWQQEHLFVAIKHTNQHTYDMGGD